MSQFSMSQHAAPDAATSAGVSPKRSDVTSSDESTNKPTVEQLRAELDRLHQRESQIMALIGCKNPDKLMHDLRNLLNEVQLLRVLADVDKA